MTGLKRPLFLIATLTVVSACGYYYAQDGAYDAEAVSKGDARALEQPARGRIPEAAEKDASPEAVRAGVEKALRVELDGPTREVVWPEFADDAERTQYAEAQQKIETGRAETNEKISEQLLASLEKNRGIDGDTRKVLERRADVLKAHAAVHRERAEQFSEAHP